MGHYPSVFSKSTVNKCSRNLHFVARENADTRESVKWKKWLKIGDDNEVYVKGDFLMVIKFQTKITLVRK
jgi:hypothetical protein